MSLYEFLVHLLLDYQVQFWYPHLKKKKKRKKKPVTEKEKIHGRMTNMIRRTKLLPCEKQSQHAEAEQKAMTSHLSFPIVLSRPGA